MPKLSNSTHPHTVSPRRPRPRFMVYDYNEDLTAKFDSYIGAADPEDLLTHLFVGWTDWTGTRFHTAKEAYKALAGMPAQMGRDIHVIEIVQETRTLHAMGNR